MTEEEIVIIFLSMKNSKSRDKNGMQIKPVKYVNNLTPPIIQHNFILAPNTGHFAIQMQIAKVKALCEGGNENQLASHYPVSVPLVFSKGLEKVIH